MPRFRTAVLIAVATGAVAIGQGADATPSFIKGEVTCSFYDGIRDDLLTGGLGKSGLEASTPPLISVPPTASELRRLAIYNNYRALVPTDAGGGYGTLFGPNVLADGTVTDDEGLVAGTECLAFAGSASGRANVTLMIQVPATFEPADACIVTAPSSGSRGIYGAIGTAGEWGLKNHCAVAYTDKGTGTGAHDLQDNTVNLITGERSDADAAGKDSIFTAKLSDTARAAFNAATPNRFGFKHAHSRLNPEGDWGLNVLRSIEFAVFQLNALCAEGEAPFACAGPITPDDAVVIASSVSNGGGASVRAAEQDNKGLIDGVAVSEPNVNPQPGGRFGIRQGTGEPLFDHSRSLYDYTTAVHIYQACANLAPANAPAPLNTAGSAERCTSLLEKGLVSGATTAAQAIDAQRILNEEFGLLVEQNIVQPSHWALFVPQAVAVTYAKAYSRARVTDNLCGYSFGATGTTFEPVPLAESAEATLFAVSNGIPPTGGVNVINNNSLGGAKRDQNSISPSTGRADQNLDGALCLRSLADRGDPATEQKLTGHLNALAKRLAASIRQIRANGDLGGTPTLFVTGRSDGVLAPNHTSRAYVGLNQVVEGSGSNLRYYEVKNAHHLDALTILDVTFGVDLFADKFVPLHHYFFQALDIMLDHLRNDTPLPPSQVVRTVPRGPRPDPSSAPPPLTLANVPPINPDPPAADRIAFEGDVLSIPE
jgi:hydroxybutyrate-dimer hydrolase